MHSRLQRHKVRLRGRTYPPAPRHGLSDSETIRDRPCDPQGKGRRVGAGRLGAFSEAVWTAQM